MDEDGMKVNIDFSVISQCGTACGVINGALDMSAIPRVGEMVSFVQPLFSSAPPAFAGQSLLMEVESVIHSPLEGGSSVSLALASLTIPSTEYTRQVFEYFEKGFGLGYDPFLDKDL